MTIDTQQYLDNYFNYSQLEILQRNRKILYSDMVNKVNQLNIRIKEIVDNYNQEIIDIDKKINKIIEVQNGKNK